MMSSLYCRIPIILLSIASLSASSSGQSIDEQVASALAKIEKGQVEEARKLSAELMAKQQNNAGVLYLQGRLATNGTEAMKDYQSIVDNFPKSDWADDALYAIYQYYYALGLYKTADLKLQQLKKEYPSSSFLSGVKPPSTMKLAEETVILPKKELPAALDSPKTALVPPVQPPAEESAEPYVLQVGAFSTVANAEKQKDYFENAGMTVEITNKVRGGRSLYLVWVGSYRTAEDAKAAATEIKKKHKTNSLVVERY